MTLSISRSNVVTQAIGKMLQDAIAHIVAVAVIDTLKSSISRNTNAVRDRLLSTVANFSTAQRSKLQRLAKPVSWSL